MEKIEVDPHTQRPDFVWSRYQVKRSKQRVEPLPVDTPIFPDQLRFVCISDTHNKTIGYTTPIPDGDVLLHCGDFTQWGKYTEVVKFNNFLETLPHRLKIVIAGNHELVLDKRLENAPQVQVDPDILKAHGASEPMDLLKACCYLEESYVEIGGYKIYGSPWTPTFCSMAFNFERGQQALDIWNRIPDDADIVMTHGPALGYGDETRGDQHVGCAELLNTIQKRVRPRFHVFGHIHESNGQHTDGTTTFINAAICDRRYRPSQPPYIFDLPLRSGQDKAAVLAEELRPVSCLPTEADGLDNALGALKLE